MTESRSIKIGATKFDLFKRCQEIRDNYPNGVPLNRKDRKTVLAALRMHPHGEEKFGPGVKAVIVDQYIYGTRCFFVIRSDDTITDFSLRKCVGYTFPSRNTKVLSAMQRFDYFSILQKFNQFIRGRNVIQNSASPSQHSDSRPDQNLRVFNPFGP